MSKALLVSATGTGKTILAASDVNQVKPERFLFIIHREQIAHEAMRSFMQHLDEPVECALLTGSDRNLNAPYLFATIQTLTKDEVLYSFDPGSTTSSSMRPITLRRQATGESLVFSPSISLG